MWLVLQKRGAVFSLLGRPCSRGGRCTALVTHFESRAPKSLTQHAWRLAASNPEAVSSGASLLLLQGQRMVGEKDLRVYLDKFDRKYWATYKVLDILQKVFYR